MLTKEQENKFIAMIPSGTEGEDRRAAYAVITGVREDKSPSQICAYYSLTMDLVEKWFNFFDFSNNTHVKKSRGRKSKDIAGYLKSNVGRVVTPKAVVEDLGISLPTFYNYLNANRHMFKKIKRGEFEILNAEEIRASQK